MSWKEEMVSKNGRAPRFSRLAALEARRHVIPKVVVRNGRLGRKMVLIVAVGSVVVTGFLLPAPLRRTFATLTVLCSQFSFFRVLHGGVLMLDGGARWAWSSAY